MQEISKIEARNESVVIFGDMNKHVVMETMSDEERKRAEQSHGGKLLNSFLEGGEYILLNDTDKMKGGPYTRYSPEDPTDDSKKSTLDLVIVSKCLFEYVDALIIDKTLKVTPYRAVNKTKLC